MTIRGVHHVQLAMPAGGEAAAVRFYAGVLGLEHVAKPAALAGRGGCWFRGDGVELHLGVEGDFRAARKAHPALLVTDLAAIEAALRAGDVELLRDVPLPGMDRGSCLDPFGNKLEFVEPT